MRGMRFGVAGLLVAGMFALVQAQPGGGFGGFGGGGVTYLVTHKAVQEDIKASEDQTKKLAEWSKEFGAKRLEMFKDSGIEFGKGGFGKIDEETRTKMAAVNAKISAEAYKQLGDVLKKEQVERVKQIERQQLGVNAFTNATVAEALKLTDAQKASVKGITGDFDKERREINAEAGIGGGGKGGKGGFAKVDPEKAAEARKKIAKVEKEYMIKVVDVLDDSQKKTWKELVGESFDLSKLTFGGFGKKDAKKD